MKKCLEGYTCCLFLSIGLLTGLPAQAESLAEGATLVPLTADGKSRAVSWAYHGDRICIMREETDTLSQLLVVRSDGSDEQAVTPMGSLLFAEWSWGGTKLSYEFSNAREAESQGGVFIYDVATRKSLLVSAPCPRSALDAWDGPYWSADDKYVVYKVLAGTARRSQVWVADTASGRHWRLLPERGQARDSRWSFSSAGTLCLLTESGGGRYDLATVDAHGKALVLLTDIGTQSVNVDGPRWSPGGPWIAYDTNIEMTQSERDKWRMDCWISRPDGTEARNLTRASSPATEKQLAIYGLIWSWDGRWILAEADRFDNQGNSIATLYRIDPIKGGYEPIATSDPRRTGRHDFPLSTKWSYDSTKIAVLVRRFAVKNWGPDAEYDSPQSILRIYDLQEGTREDILTYDEQLDRKRILATSYKGALSDISWSPDNRSILLTIAEIVSREDGIRRPDVYRLDLPGRLIAAGAAQHIGPPVGANAPKMSVAARTAQVEPTPNVGESPPDSVQEQASPNGSVTEVLRPVHMTVEEAVASLPGRYGRYFTTNPARNLLLFKGPATVLAEFRDDLKRIDTPPPHILVDLLAVELSDEANRKLGLDWTYSEGHFAFFQPAGRAIQQFGHEGTGEDYRVGFPSGALDTLGTLSGTGQSFYQGVGELPREFFIRLNTLVKEGEGTILANPRTVAMSGKESLINIRKTLNYFFNEGFDVSGRPIVKKSDISADTEGRIVPTLLADGTIHLRVDVKVGNFTFTPDQGLPELTTRQSTTEVTVQEGQTLVLGGLRQQEMSSATTKVPVLGDVPVFGRLFKHDETNVKNSVLTIFITPHMLRPNGPAPEWPQLDPGSNKLVPIMPVAPRRAKK